MAASDAFDVLVLVHDFPYKSMPAEVATANDVTLQLLAACQKRDRGAFPRHAEGDRTPDSRARAGHHHVLSRHLPSSRSQFATFPSTDPLAGRGRQA